ncbi:hypothetical protein RCO48_33490 [Peribacillus frigoritolerans]|nr:hypothetical protein [Peribacillus frigoritolerans]
MKKFATLLPNNWLAERERISEINCNFNTKKKIEGERLFLRIHLQSKADIKNDVSFFLWKISSI